jgi:hypothetical protein
MANHPFHTSVLCRSEPCGLRVLEANPAGLPAERSINRQLIRSLFLNTGSLILIRQGLHELAETIQIVGRQFHFQGQSKRSF